MPVLWVVSTVMNLGFYNVLGDRVKLEFAALTIYSHPFTKSNVLQLYQEAKQLILEEEIAIQSGESSKSL